MYQQLLQHVAQPLTIPTLGERREITFEFSDGQILLFYSYGNSFLINEEFFNLVRDQYINLDDNVRDMASSYSQPKWENCPNRVIAPYVAALIHHFRNLL